MSLNKKLSCDIIILLILCLPFLYVLSAMVFPCIKISFRLLSETSTESFNRVMEGLSIGYLSSVFIYVLTTFVRGKVERNKRFYELYDFFYDLYDAVRYLENEFGMDTKYFDGDDFSMFTEEVQKKFLEKLKKQLDRTLNFREILLPEEVNIISEINRMYGGIEPYYDGMQDKEKGAKADTLKLVCILVSNLKDSITEEMYSKSKKKLTRTEQTCKSEQSNHNKDNR